MTHLHYAARHKKIVLGLLAIVLLAAMLIWIPGPIKSGATIVISPSSILNQAGQTWTAEVTVESNQPVNSVDTTIYYDPDLVELKSVDISSADFEVKIFEPVINAKEGTVRFVQTSLQSLDGQDNNVANLEFKGVKQGQLQLVAGQTKIVADDGQGTDLYHPSLNQSIGGWLISLINN